MKYALLAFLFPAVSYAADLQGIVDRDLKITIEEIARTVAGKEYLVIRLNVERDGRNFQMPCDREGEVTAEGSTNTLLCAINLGTVSGDDDESLQFQVTMETNAEDETATYLNKIFYTGDGTMLGKNVEVLTNKKHSDKSIEDLSIELAPAHINPTPGFQQGFLAIAALKPLIAKQLKFDIGNDMNMTVRKGRKTVEVSVLRRAGKLSGGYRSAAAVRREVKSGLGL